MIFLDNYSLPFSNTFYSWLEHSLSNSCHSRSSFGGGGEASSALPLHPAHHLTALEQDLSLPVGPFWVLDITWISAGCCCPPSLPAGDKQGAPLATSQPDPARGDIHLQQEMPALSHWFSHDVILRSSSFEKHRPGKHRTDDNTAQELSVDEVAACAGHW